MAGKSNLSATLFAQKKLLGKANTSVVKSDSQEVIGSNIQVAAQTIFAEDIPDNPSQTLYLLQSASAGSAATVEWVQFDLSAISGTTYDANTYDDDSKIGNPQDAGPHAYKLALSASYESLSSNTNKGNGIFDDSKALFETLGSLQIVPPNFSGQSPNPYILKLYKGTPSEVNEIPLLDEIDWSIDYYNGILFLQDYDASKIPLYARGFVYTGKMLSASLGSGGGGGSISGGTNLGSGTGVFSAVNGSNLEFKSIVAGSGVTVSSDSTSITIATNTGASTITGASRFVKLVESKIAAASGITFSDLSIENSHDSGSLDIYHNGQLLLSGSSAQVSAGTADYYSHASNGFKFGFDLFADDVISVKKTTISNIDEYWTSPSSGFLQTSASVSFAGNLGSSHTTNNIGRDTFMFVSGTMGSKNSPSIRGAAVFGGDVVISGTLHGGSPLKLGSHITFVDESCAQITGSLTKVFDGTSYMIAGTQIEIITGSKGNVTINADAAASGSNFMLFSDNAELDNARVLNAGEGISISTASPRQITISNSGIIGRTKKFYDITGSHAANSMFEVSGSVFSDVGYSPDLIDVYHNGISLRSGSNHDYTLFHTGAINFKFDLLPDDIVQVVVFK